MESELAERLSRSSSKAKSGKAHIHYLSLIAKQFSLPGFKVCSGGQALEALDESLLTVLPRVRVCCDKEYIFFFKGHNPKWVGAGVSE